MLTPPYGNKQTKGAKFDWYFIFQANSTKIYLLGIKIDVDKEDERNAVIFR